MEAETRSKVGFLVKYIWIIILWFLMIVYQYLRKYNILTKVTSYMLPFIGIGIIAVVVVYNSSNIIKTYGACDNPYADLTNMFTTIISFNCNYLLFLIKVSFVLVGVLLVFNLISHTVALNMNVQNILKAKQFYLMVGSWMPSPLFKILYLVVFFVLMALHVISYIIVLLFPGKLFFDEFNKKSLLGDGTRKSAEFFEIFYQLFKFEKPYYNNVIITGALISTIIATYMGLKYKPENACTDPIIESKYIDAMDYQMSIAWIIIIVVYIQYFKHIWKDITTNAMNSSSDEDDPSKINFSQTIINTIRLIKEEKNKM